MATANLPSPADHEEFAPARAKPAGAADEGCHSVLLVEDDPDDALLLESALSSQRGSAVRTKYSVRREGTLAGAVAALAAQAVDIAVVDLTLPDSRGIDTITQLRAAAPEMALVVLTGHDDDALALAALRAGAHDYLVKGRISDALLERSIRDALERKLTEQQRDSERAEREALQEQLRHSQRMEAVGRLAAGVAHDFNNLLTVILCHAQQLTVESAESAESGDSRASAAEILRAAERASRLTRQLLAFSRQQPMTLRVLNVNALVADVESMVSRLIGENITLATTLDASLPNVRADAGHLEQVLMNLAVNARDAMPDGGQLSIKTAVVEVDARMPERPYVKPGRYVHLSVSDTGCAMSDAVRARIFEPFFTTKETGHGTGLGLSTVYGIVKQAEGYIWCTSVPGLGTRFDIYLPSTDAQLEQVAESADPGAAAASGRILVVEDESAVRSVVTRSLRAAGFDVVEAASGGEALALAQAQSTPIDLLITDMVMPGLGGREVATRLREMVPSIRVLYMSGYTEDDVVRHRRMTAGESFLQKPFVVADLLGAARDLLGRRLPLGGAA